ncbi:MAG: nucleotidyltransferase domain-containing protein [Armatimonadota bacterium]
MHPDWLSAEPRTPAEEFLCRVVDAARATVTRVWLYGGYALEILLGRRIREHDDVEFLAKLQDWPRLFRLIANPEYRFDYAAPTALHVYRGSLCVADVLLAEDHPDGFPFIRAPLGANPLPPRSLSDGPVVTMWGRRVQVVTLECLFVMKASGNFTGPRPESNPKHRSDLELIEGRLTAAAIRSLAPYCRVIAAP